MRYRSKLQFEIYLDEKAQDTILPKLILQPLVENAIYHGIKPKEAGGIIFVWCFLQEDTLYLRVKDNGIGMDEDVLQYLQQASASKGVENRENYGIVNVDERLRLFFGNRYSMVIESKPDMGTEFTIKIKMETRSCTN